MHLLTFKLAMGQLKQKPWSRVAAVLSASVILTMVGLLTMFHQGMGKSIAELEASHAVVAYIEPSASMPSVVSAIRKMPGVIETQQVSKAEFAKKYGRALGANVDAIEDDLIPQYVRIRLTSSEPKKAVQKIEKLHGVESAELASEKVVNVVRALTGLQLLVAFVCAVLTIALLGVLMNHFKLCGQMAQQTRTTLKGLGASKAFVALPSLLEGAVEGLLAGVLSAVLVFVVSGPFGDAAAATAKSLGLNYVASSALTVAAAVAVLGALLGVVGSLWTVAKSLR